MFLDNEPVPTSSEHALAQRCASATVGPMAKVKTPRWGWALTGSGRISDNLATNVFAQAGKCRVPTIVFACDTAPELETEAPEGMVNVFPRRIDLDNSDRLKSFEATDVVETLAELEQALSRRKRAL